MSKSKAQELARRLRARGVRNARATPQLIELAKLDVSEVDLLATIEAAGAAGDPFAYGVTVLLNRLRMTPASAAAASDWENAPRGVVEARGVELGVGKWNELEEQWPRYKARVTAAGRQRLAA